LSKKSDVIFRQKNKKRTHEFEKKCTPQGTRFWLRFCKKKKQAVFSRKATKKKQTGVRVCLLCHQIFEKVWADDPMGTHPGSPWPYMAHPFGKHEQERPDD